MTSSIIDDVTDGTEYLKKHVKLIKKNPGLQWCLVHGINKINEAISDIKKVVEEGNHRIRYYQETSSKLEIIIEQKDKEILRLNETIGKQHKLWKTTLDRRMLHSTWRVTATKYNDKYKELIERLEEKLQCIPDDLKNYEDKSTQSGTK